MVFLVEKHDGGDIIKRFLKRNISRIYVMLGNGCNLNCVYCLQHPLVSEPLSVSVNPDIYEFFKQVSEENAQRVRFVFYGGEPLIYFPTLREIVRNIECSGMKCSFGLISNGKALNDEMVEFFNEHDFGCTISWDGKASSITRGYDVFSDETQRRRIMRLPHLCLSGVISSKASPLEILNDFQSVYEEYGHDMGVNLDVITDTGLHDTSLLQIDLEKVSNHMSILTDVYLKALKGDMRSSDMTKISYMEGLMQRLSFFYKRRDKGDVKITSTCGNGLSVLNIDLNGNLYPCHNTSVSVGNIRSGYFQYLQKIIQSDVPVIERRRLCEECYIAPLCNGGCRYVRDLQPFCELRNALYAPFIDALFREKILMPKETE